MRLNESQKLIIGTIVSGMLGIPDIEDVFSREVIKIVMANNPSPTMIFIVSILKIMLVIASVVWLYYLARNAEFTYRTKSKQVFENYLLKLVLTTIITIILMLLAKAYFHI